MVHSRRFLFRLCGALLFFFLASSGNAAESNLYRSELGTAQLSAESPIHAGTPFDVKLNLTLAPHWHTYADPPGEAGIPPRIDWELPEGFSAGSLRFPAPRSFHEGGLTTYGYENRVTLTSRFTPAATLRDAVTIKARASWLVCHDICIPESAAFTLMLPASAVPREHGAEGLSYILLLALLGGLVLNLMPCVLPVLSFKALSLSRLAHIHPAAARMEGIAYTLGIATCFGALAAMLIALRQAGAAIGWGYQLQSPAFVAFLAVLLFLIGLSFSGWLRLPGFSMGRGVAAPRHPFWNSFFTGTLAALVATPCTAPFMAAATGYALTLAALPALLVFEVMALGLALPFLLISFFPAALRFLPRPGAWMERLKELLAFPMYISATWLVWVLAMQAGADAVAAVLLTMQALAFLAWWQRGALSPAMMLAAAVLWAGGVWAVHHTVAAPLSANHPEAVLRYGEKYRAERLEALRAGGAPVFVDATAAWCITCQINDHTSLSSDAVQKAFAERHITMLVADWTRKDAEITALLERFGRRGVPLYVYFPPHGEPRVLPQLLTPGIVLAAIKP